MHIEWKEIEDGGDEDSGEGNGDEGSDEDSDDGVVMIDEDLKKHYRLCDRNTKVSMRQEGFDSTITNVCPFIRQSVSPKAKPIFILHPSSFIFHIHPYSFIPSFLNF